MASNWDLLENEAQRRAGRAPPEQNWRAIEQAVPGYRPPGPKNVDTMQLFEMLRNARTPEERKMLAKMLVQNTTGGAAAFAREYGEAMRQDSVMPQQSPAPPPNRMPPSPVQAGNYSPLSQPMAPPGPPLSPGGAQPGAAAPQPGGGLSLPPQGQPNPGPPRPAPRPSAIGMGGTMQRPGGMAGAGGPRQSPPMQRPGGMAGAGGPGLPPMQGPQQPQGMEAFWHKLAGLLNFGQPSGGSVVYPGQQQNQFPNSRISQGLL